ncbi:hypothetical protein [Methylocella sp.]|uniref:hypothetical protein n=1 Tax=Methylocella sp. TaxID=1978226 RepID=UPI003784CAD8
MPLSVEHSADWRRPIWIGTLVAASVAFSLGFACAAPFAAFAALAALTMPARPALALIGLVWFANQAVGFLILHYPADSIGWGLAIGVGAVGGAFAARAAARALPAPEPLRYALAFLAAFAVYEAALLAMAIATGGGHGAFTAEIMGQVFAINAAAFLGLLALNRTGEALGLVIRPDAAAAMLGRGGSVAPRA